MCLALPPWARALSAGDAFIDMTRTHRKQCEWRLSPLHFCCRRWHGSPKSLATQELLLPLQQKCARAYQSNPATPPWMALVASCGRVATFDKAFLGKVSGPAMLALTDELLVGVWPSACIATYRSSRRGHRGMNNNFSMLCLSQHDALIQPTQNT